jgi:hypothetical protein
VNSLTEQQIRASFVNATRGEIARAVLPDLSDLPWERLDLLGWRDRRSPQSSAVVLDVDGELTGILLRAADAPPGRRRALCEWCRDITSTDDVTLYVARRAGAAGRAGNTLGTLICTDFRCSANVRRTPTYEEAGTDDPGVRAEVVQRRVDGLRERSTRFVREVLRTR